MPKNLSHWQRALRLLAGVITLAWAIAGGPWWAYFGIYLIATAAWSFCPLVAIFRGKN